MRGFSILSNWRSDILVGLAEEAVLAVEVASNRALCVDEQHVGDHQNAVASVVPLDEFLHIRIGGHACGEIGFEGLEVHREVGAHALFKGGRHHLHIARGVVLLDDFEDPGQFLAVSNRSCE